MIKLIILAIIIGAAVSYGMLSMSKDGKIIIDTKKIKEKTEQVVKNNVKVK